MSVVAFPRCARASEVPLPDRPAPVVWIFSARAARRVRAYWRSVPNGPGAAHDHPAGGQMRLPVLAILIFWGVALWAVLR